MAKRSVNGANRDERGRFVKGNPGGPGNPLAKKVMKLRSALLDAVTKEDLIGVVNALVGKAKEGDTAAAKILFDRLLGRPLEADILERIEALEKRVEER